MQERFTGQILQRNEARGDVYFSGTPVEIGASHVLHDRRLVRYLRPMVPVTADFALNRFVPDADKPVVCVTSLAQMAVFRALSHQSLHTCLPLCQRRTGWRYDGDMPTYLATAALLEHIQAMRDLDFFFDSTVAILQRNVARFEQHTHNRHEFRAYQAVPFYKRVSVSLDLWPPNVEECPPWPPDFDLSSYAPYEPDLAEYMAKISTEKAFPGYVERVVVGSSPSRT